jgi:hypothetical protein
MPRLPGLAPDYAIFRKEVSYLRNIVSDSERLEPKYQRLIAEVALIRLSFCLDNVSEGIFSKLLAGAKYLDESRPTLLVSTKSIHMAKDYLLSYNRTRQNKPFKMNYFSWADAAAYQDMIKHTFDSSDPCFSVITAHGAAIKEIKSVRNYVAHRSGSARTKYKSVLKQHYGADIFVSAGQFLTTRRFSRIMLTPSPIQWYISAAEIFVKELYQPPNFLTLRGFPRRGEL